MTTPNKTHRLPDFPHGLPAADVLAALGVSVSTGLSEEEAGLRLKLYGSNTISSRRKVSVLAIIVHQFRSLVVALLAAAAGSHSISVNGRKAAQSSACLRSMP